MKGLWSCGPGGRIGGVGGNDVVDDEVVQEGRGGENNAGGCGGGGGNPELCHIGRDAAIA